ncbi:hypothetical protein HOY82DRAFT_551655 [Tuber indicum]|nr:hypothetical protein HOY82DRAFT_551655 [Tuber indicum]
MVSIVLFFTFFAISIALQRVELPVLFLVLPHTGHTLHHIIIPLALLEPFFFFYMHFLTHFR